MEATNEEGGRRRRGGGGGVCGKSSSKAYRATTYYYHYLYIVWVVLIVVVLLPPAVVVVQANPTEPPTASPTKSPTKSPTSSPTKSPTSSPTSSPTKSPTSSPTKSPTSSPTKSPTSSPTSTTASPTKSPTSSPTSSPTKSPTAAPTATTASPTKSPTASPTWSPLAFAGPQAQEDYTPPGEARDGSVTSDPIGSVVYGQLVTVTIHGNPEYKYTITNVEMEETPFTVEYLDCEAGALETTSCSFRLQLVYFHLHSQVTPVIHYDWTADVSRRLHDGGLRKELLEEEEEQLSGCNRLTAAPVSIRLLRMGETL